MNDDYINELAKKDIERLLGGNSDDSLQPYRVQPAMQWVEPIPITNLGDQINEKVDWIWEGFIAKGHMTLLSALWKSGKTTLTTWLLATIQNEGSIAGKSTFPSKVLVLSEESKSIWNERREKFTLVDGIWVSCRPIKGKLNTKEWESFLAYIADFCVKNAVDLVIVDTLTTFWPVKDENDAGQVSTALLPLNALLEQNIGVLLIHHLKKTDGGEATASRGSGALPSFVDIIVEFRRFNGAKNDDSRRVLTCYSRFNETPLETVIELTPDGYITQGVPAEVRQKDRLNILLELIPIEPSSITINGILSKWSKEHGPVPDRTTIFRGLKLLDRAEEIFILGKSPHKGKADLWARFGSIALQTSSNSNAHQTELPIQFESEEKDSLK